MKRLGDSVDWSRERFTLDDGLSATPCRPIFKRMFDDGLIYRAERIINWCPGCLTALSRHRGRALRGRRRAGVRSATARSMAIRRNSVVVATTRVETMLGDTAVAVHPDDERYRAPGRADRAAAHREPGDPGGRRRARRPDSSAPARSRSPRRTTRTTSRSAAGTACRRRRSWTRRPRSPTPEPVSTGWTGSRRGPRSRQELRAQGRIVAEKIPYVHAVGHCSRSDDVIEPRLSTQWFVKVEPLAKAAGDAVRDGRTKIHPPELAAQVLRLGRQHARLVHLPAVVVGSPDPGLVRPGRRDPLRRAGRGATGRGLDPGPGRAGHLVLLRACGRSPPWAGREETDTLQGVLPDVGAGHRLRHPVLLGRPDDDVRAVRHPRPRTASRRCRFTPSPCTAWSATSTARRCPSRKGNTVDPLQWIEDYGADAVRFTLARGLQPGRRPGHRRPNGSPAPASSARSCSTPPGSPCSTARWCPTVPLIDGRSHPGRPVDPGPAGRGGRTRPPTCSPTSSSARPPRGSTTSPGTRSATGIWSWPRCRSPGRTRRRWSRPGRTTRQVLGTVLDGAVAAAAPVRAVRHRDPVDLADRRGVPGDRRLADAVRPSCGTGRRGLGRRCADRWPPRSGEFQADQRVPPGRALPAADHRDARSVSTLRVRALTRLTGPGHDDPATASGRASPLSVALSSGIATVELDTSGTLDVPAEIARTTKDLAAARRRSRTRGRKLGNADVPGQGTRGGGRQDPGPGGQGRADVDRLTERLHSLREEWHDDRAIGRADRSAPTGDRRSDWAGTPTRSSPSDAAELALGPDPTGRDRRGDRGSGRPGAGRDDGAGAGLAAVDPRVRGVAPGPPAQRGADLADPGPDHRAAGPAGQPAALLPGHP